MLHINQLGLNIIKTFEGYSADIYLCPAGFPTIGYGHRVTTNEYILEKYMTKEIAERYLIQDLNLVEKAINKLIKTSLNENQFSALCSFVYNLGSGRLQASTLRSKLNRGEYKNAAEEFLKWDKVNGKSLKGLTLRRQAEYKLFNLGI